MLTMLQPRGRRRAFSAHGSPRFRASATARDAPRSGARKRAAISRRLASLATKPFARRSRRPKYPDKTYFQRTSGTPEEARRSAGRLLDRFGLLPRVGNSKLKTQHSKLHSGPRDEALRASRPATEDPGQDLMPENIRHLRTSTPNRGHDDPITEVLSARCQFRIPKYELRITGALRASRPPTLDRMFPEEVRHLRTSTPNRGHDDPISEGLSSRHQFLIPNS